MRVSRRRRNFRLGTGQANTRRTEPSRTASTCLSCSRPGHTLNRLDRIKRPALTSPGVSSRAYRRRSARAGFSLTPALARLTRPRRRDHQSSSHRDGARRNGRLRFVGSGSSSRGGEDCLFAPHRMPQESRDRYRALAVASTRRRALGNGADQLFPRFPANPWLLFEYGDAAKTERSLSRAAHVTRHRAGRQAGRKPDVPNAALPRTRCAYQVTTYVKRRMAFRDARSASVIKTGIPGRKYHGPRPGRGWAGSGSLSDPMLTIACDASRRR